MTKSELNQAITDRTKLDTIMVSNITESLFLVIKQEVTTGNKVTFKGFGTFKPKIRSAKKAQLIKNKQTILLPERSVPTFLPSESLRNIIR